MCVISMVHDHFAPRIPDAGTFQWPPPDPFAAPLAELRQLIADFRAACTAAKVVDEKTAQPDCLDPAKAGLEARVAELERRLNAMADAGAGR